jgi:hypothetical protein
MNVHSVTKLAAALPLVLGFHAHAAAPEGRFLDVKPVAGINSPFALDAAPTPSAGGLELFFSSERPGGMGDIDIWVAGRPDVHSSWEVDRNVGELNTGVEEQPWWISPDGRRLYFYRFGEGGCLATREPTDAGWTDWTDEGPIEDLGHPANFPTLTADELDIFFNSDRPGGKGSMDIWTAARWPNREASWGEPENVEPINTAASDGASSISPDGCMICFDQWYGGNEGTILCATRAERTQAFGPVNPLPPPVNSDLWEGHAHFSHDWPAAGSLFYFIRGASRETFEIYQATWEPMPVFKRGDANANGTVDISDAVYTLQALFAGGAPIACPDAADANDDEAVNLADALYTLQYLFANGPALPAPFLECGTDPTPHPEPGGEDLPACTYDPGLCGS